MKNFLAVIILFFFCNACASSTSIKSPETTVANVTNNLPDGLVLEGKTYKLDDLEIVEIDGPSVLGNQNGEMQAWINKNELAPFDGILLNPEAMAYIISEYGALKLRSQRAIEKQRLLDVSKLQLETGGLQLELQTNQKKYQILIDGRDNEIKRLQKINKDILEDKSNIWDDLLIAGGSGAAGILIGLLIYALAK